jgi:hypothetical protein
VVIFMHDACDVNFLLALHSILSSRFNLNKQLFGFCNCYQIVGWHFVRLNLCKHLANLVRSEGIPRNTILTMS